MTISAADVKNSYLIKDSSANISEPQILTSGDEIYFEVFHIQPIKLDISFMRTESANIERRCVGQLNLVLPGKD